MSVSTILAGGSLAFLLRYRAEVESLRAQAEVNREEARDLAFKRSMELAEYYRQRLKECEGSELGSGSHQIPPKEDKK